MLTLNRRRDTFPLIYNRSARTCIVSGALDDPDACAWTLVSDAPTTGPNGQILATGDWAGVSRDGWSLRAVHDDGYVFEQCR
jgi:hypothetical protein